MAVKLADASEPLVLADGTVIAVDGRVERPKPTTIEVPSNTEAQRIVIATRRKLIDFPTPPKQLNALAVVAAYTLVGLDDSEIAIATGVPVEQVKRIKMTDAYGEFERDVTVSIRNADVSDVRTLIEGKARRAAERIGELAASDDEAIALHASKDILDRAGHRPVDVVEHRHTMEGALRIEYVDSRGASELPTIDITPED